MFRSLTQFFRLSPFVVTLLSGAAVASASAGNNATIETPGVIQVSYAQPIDRVQRTLYGALEDKGFFVVFRADMGARMASMKERWGDNYNRHQLSDVRAMVFCNIGWTHQIADADPVGLAVCPLHVAIYQQDAKSVVLLPRPSVTLAGTPAEERAIQLENELAGILKSLFD